MSALRTISLRIRGTSVKVLEEMGEETDGVIESVSKLQAKVKGLSGVDILTDTGAYKDTYTIIKEIAQVWDQMSDINQAALLELLAGKNRSNAMAALLGNLKDLEGAYNDAMEAQGSAEAENTKYLDSIQGRIDKFTNAVQTMWNNALGSDTIKTIVSFGTALIKLVDKVGLLKSSLIVLLGVIVPLKSFLKSTKDMSIAQRIGKVVNAIKGFSNIDISSKIIELIKTLGLADTAFAKYILSVLTATTVEASAAGVTSVLGKAFIALKTIVIDVAAKIYAALGPVGIVIGLITLAVAGLVAAYIKWGPTHKNYIKRLEEETNNLKEIRSELESLNSELETTKNRIEELESKGPLALTEQEELDKLKEQNAELERQIRLEEAREERAKNKQAKTAQGAFETDDDFKSTQRTQTDKWYKVLYPGAAITADLALRVIDPKNTNEFEKKIDSIADAKDELDKAETALQDALNSGLDTNSKKFQKLEKKLESAQEDYTDAQSDWDEFMQSKEEEYGDLEWFDGDNLTEAQKTVNEIISSMQNYTDRAEIMFGSAGAKESALDRLFGERGSDAGKAFQDAFNSKIESGEIEIDVDKFSNYSDTIDDVTNSVESLISDNPQLKVQLDSLGISAEDVARYFLNIHSAMQQTDEIVSTSVTDIETLTSAYDSYASALQIVNNAIFDGQAISDDYYDSLKEYLGSVAVGEEDFSDAIDTTNGKVVKNTKLLRSLITEKKKEQKATISAAKAQSQLQYTKIVRQLQQAVKAMALDYNAYGYVTKATYDNISAMHEQVQAIKNAIREYAVLELKLSDVTNAYDEFENAKNRDEELAYGDSMIEMLQTISDGFLNGQVGSEAFKAAVQALVPESVIANCETFEERLDAIDNYFENSKFADYFTIDEDGSFSIAIKNIEAFIADAKEAGAFLSNSDGTFTIDDSIRGIEDLANVMGITKEATAAMLTELSKYDASWGDIVADITMTSLDKGIRDTTDALDAAIAKQEQFFKEGKDPSGTNAEEYISIQREINNCSDALNDAQEAVINNTNSWIDASNNVDIAKENVAKLTKELQELHESGATDNEIQIKTNELENATQKLSEALQIKYGLEEPTQMDFQIVLDNVQSQIDQWKEENSTLVTEVVPKLAQDENGVWKIPAEIELDESEKQKLQAYVDLLNDQEQLELFTSEDVDPIVGEITQVKDVLDNIYNAIESLNPNVDSSGVKDAADKTSNVTNSKATQPNGGNVKASNTSSTTSGSNKSSQTTSTTTSGSSGFSSESVDQQIAAWNAKVDEWIENAKQFINKFGESISKFFTETLPEQWNIFWSSVGEKLNQVGEWAQATGAEIGIFFTETLPQKWSEFWSGVGEWLDGVKEWASNTGEDIGKFFTETLPQKWSEFWAKVGEFISEIPYNVSYLVTKVKIFFTEIIPEKWDEFWDNVGDAINNLKEKAVELGNRVHDFFTVTIPEKWNMFWDEVGNKLNNLKEDAIALGNKVRDFFTVTIPTEWNAFWDSVGTYINDVITPALDAAWTKVSEFFTVTIPEKWSAFWTAVDTYVNEVIQPALISAGNAIYDFFMVTIPAKWNEFWTDVGNFVTQTIPEAFNAVKDGVNTFFTETVPEAINGLWKSAASWISEKANSFWSFLKGEWIRGKEDAEKGTYNPSGDSEALGNALAKGNAHSKKKPGLNIGEHNAVVGELGRELVVDPNKGIYYTVGENGTQMVDLPKGAIVYNHKQTEELLKNGETSRGTYTGGLSFAKGNAYWDYGTYTKKTGTGAKAAWGDGSNKDWTQMGWNLDNASDSVSDAADSISDAADEFEEVFDWFEILLEEIEDNISLMNAKLENAIGISAKKGIYSEIINTEQFKLQELYEGIKLYSDYANKLLAKVPDQYKEMAKNGAIAITDFLGEANEEVVESINNYREWAKKVTDLNQQLEETKKTIADTHVEVQSMIKDEYDNRISLITSVNDRIQETIDLLDEEGKRSSAVMYEEMIKNSTKQLSELQNKRAEMQKALDEAVTSGNVEKESSQWYEMVNAIGDVDSEINDCKISLEGFQNSINQLHWDNFEKLIDAIDNVGTEISNLGDLIDEEDVVDDVGNWTNKGITALGLYAQEMERAKYRAEQYGKEIEYLNEQYADGKYSEDEYLEKLQELKDGQFDSIKSYESAKKAIVDLNKTRVEAVKDGIQKEIDAYSELIDKKKEELNLQKDAHDFQKQVTEQQKNIADIQKKLAALSGDNSASAIAQRKKLEAELAAAQEELDEIYYNHRTEKQQEALDKSLEDYQNNKQDEMDALDESLKNEEQIIADSYATIAANTESIAQTLSDIASEYGITLSDSVTKPWLDGANAIGTYQEKLDTSMSSFTQQLETIKNMFADLQAQADSTGKSMVDAINSSKSKTESATYTPPTPSQPSKPSTPSKPSAPSAGSSVTVKKSATRFSRDGGNGTRMQSWVPGSTFTVYQVSGSEVLIGRNGQYTGWVRLSDIEGYSSGTKKVSNDQLALIDELGEELVLHAGKNGKLQFLSKGSSVIPADITSNLMKLGSLDPTDVLERNKPSIGAPHVIDNSIELKMEFGSLVHVDTVSNDTLPYLQKMVRSEFDNCMKHVNQGLKKFVR